MKEQKMLQQRWLRWSLIFGCWTLLGLFFGLQTYLINTVAYGQTIPWWQALTWALSDWYLWAALVPLVLNLARHFRLERHNWSQSLSLHLPVCVLLSLLHLALFVIITQAIGGAPGNHETFIAAFQVAFAVNFHWNVLRYWMIASIGHALDYYRESRERELKTSQLEARLAQAQLQTLKMQLHPHFLFNTLHAISALMYTDLEAADRMLSRLSDLLRLTLENAGAQEVPLKQELEFLERYLEIERTRFEDRLMVKLDIDAEALDARVPNLMLQPLVENAIRHGIAPREEAGRIEIRARRRQGTLLLEVRDDGPGLPNGQENDLKEGIGLANTRARLEQLHGAAHRFELSNAADGGLVVSLQIPFKTEIDERPEE